VIFPVGSGQPKTHFSAFQASHNRSIYRRDDSSIGDCVYIGLFVEFRGGDTVSPPSKYAPAPCMATTLYGCHVLTLQHLGKCGFYRNRSHNTVVDKEEFVPH